jgi:hypothetical protein
LLAEILLAQDDAEGAEPLLDEAMDICRTMQPLGHWYTGHVASLQGAALAALGRTQEAEPLLAEGVDTLRVARGDRDRHTQAAIARLARFYRDTRRLDLAEPLERLLTDGH